MSEYSPALLAAKWTVPLSDLLAECEALWEKERPVRRWILSPAAEKDAVLDQATPRRDQQLLLTRGRVVLGHFARAFFPAYIRGSQTHYGSVVYATDPARSAEVFELAWRVNELRSEGGSCPSGTERVAAAIHDDKSHFARIELPVELGVNPGCYFANICILRPRLPLGYLHTRLVPILIAPDDSRWCSLLPLRAWSGRFKALWSSGPPAYEPELFMANCRRFGIVP